VTIPRGISARLGAAVATTTKHQARRSRYIRLLTKIPLQPTADTDRTSGKRSLVKFKQRPKPRKHPIAVLPRWVPLSAASPYRGKGCRTVRFRARELSGQVMAGGRWEWWATEAYTWEARDCEYGSGSSKRSRVMKWKKARYYPSVFTERGMLLQVNEHNIPHAYGAAARRGRNLRNNYALRLRSENWGVLCAAIGSSKPRRGYSQRSVLILLSHPAFGWLVLSVPSPQWYHTLYQAQETPLVRYSSTRRSPTFTGRTPRRINGRTTSCRISGR